MYWIIRWTDTDSGIDKSIVLEAENGLEAERMGLKRNIPIAFLGEATPADVAAARKARRLLKYTPDARYRCFGRPVGTREVAALMFAGVATAYLHLRTLDIHAFF
jgi:hypothetical protein